MVYKPTADNHADVLTKSLPREVHEKHCDALMNRTWQSGAYGKPGQPTYIFACAPVEKPLSVRPFLWSVGATLLDGMSVQVPAATHACAEPSFLALGRVVAVDTP